MNYYWFNRKEILQKAKERYSKEKAVMMALNTLLVTEKAGLLNRYILSYLK